MGQFGKMSSSMDMAAPREGLMERSLRTCGLHGLHGLWRKLTMMRRATLLLTHMPSQKVNQQRMETYLSASANPSFDIAAHMEASHNGRPRLHRSNTSGTDTPRDLNTRLKLLELYALHVLPQNEEWDYARDFISMSEALDDERREAFLLALESLREEKKHDAVREVELRKRQEDELEKRRQDEARAAEEAVEQRRNQEAEQRERRAASSNAAVREKTNPSRASQLNGNNQNNSQRPPGPASRHDRHDRQDRKRAPAPSTLYGRASLMMASLQNSLLHARRSVSRNPMALLRFVLFLLAFMLAFARRDVRERMRRISGDAWDTLRRTMGMGVKVSYI